MLENIPGSILSVVQTAAPVREQVLTNIRSAIVEGRFRPGDRLTERELCSLTGVSRTSIREALRQLEVEGLVTNVPNKGPVVATVTYKEAKDIYEVRAVLEGLAGRLFAKQATVEQIAELTRAMQRIEELVESGDQMELLRAKNQFYDVLLHGCGNDAVNPLLTSLHDRVAFLRAVTLAQPGRAATSVEEIRRILSAVEQHDEDAAWKACVEHVQNAAAVALQALSEQEKERK